MQGDEKCGRGEPHFAYLDAARRMEEFCGKGSVSGEAPVNNFELKLYAQMPFGCSKGRRYIA